MARNTHIVNVGNQSDGSGYWLALNDQPSTSTVTDNSQISQAEHFWTSETFVSFENGTECSLIEEGVGYNCEWDYVKIQHPRHGELTGFFYNKFLTPIDNEEIKSTLDCYNTQRCYRL